MKNKWIALVFVALLVVVGVGYGIKKMTVPSDINYVGVPQLRSFDPKANNPAKSVVNGKVKLVSYGCILELASDPAQKYYLDYASAPQQNYPNNRTTRIENKTAKDICGQLYVFVEKNVKVTGQIIQERVADESAKPIDMKIIKVSAISEL